MHTAASMRDLTEKVEFRIVKLEKDKNQNIQELKLLFQSMKTDVTQFCIFSVESCSYLPVPQPIFSITASRQLNSAVADARQNIAIIM